ncbi:hypothetical protein Ciccas_002235 [Cichlidogyrus casuarinus]|uniref:IMD domain-containing protein n=1 Tax=Cichlidogyrus casuarinus TaxID=1844966 RepID=A0ABD2QKX8_9PLAT
MVNPLTTKIEDWRRFPGSSEKEYQRSLKDAKSKLKGLMGDSQKLSKKSKKNQSSKLNQLQTMNNRISFQGSVIRDIEIQMLKSLMLEERARYCFLANCFNPIFELQLKMFNEVAQLEDLVFQLQQLSREPDKLIGEGQKQLVAFVGNNDSSFDNNPPCFTSLNGSIVDGQSLSSHSSSELNPGRKTLVPTQEFTATDSGINLCPNNKSNGIFESVLVNYIALLHFLCRDGLSFVGATMDKTSILSTNSSLSNTSSSSRPSQDCTLGRSRVEPEESESEEESEEEASSSSSEGDLVSAIPHSPSCQAGLKSVSRPQSPVAATLDRRATVSGPHAASIALRMIKSQTLGPNHRKNRPDMFNDTSCQSKLGWFQRDTPPHKYFLIPNHQQTAEYLFLVPNHRNSTLFPLRSEKMLSTNASK